MINFRNSLKILLPKIHDAPSHKKQKNLLRAQCALHGVDRVKKKQMKLLTNKQQKSYENAKICYIYKEKLKDKYGHVQKT